MEYNHALYSYDNFVTKEELWPYVREEFRQKLIYSNLCGRGFQGFTGDSLNIVTSGEATVSRYNSYSNPQIGQKLDSNIRKLQIRHDIMVSISVEARDLQRANPIDLQEKITKAGIRAVANAIEGVTSQLYADVYPDHIIGSDDQPIDLTQDRNLVYDLINDADKILNDCTIPEEGRYVVGPPAFWKAMRRNYPNLYVPTPIGERRFIKGFVSDAFGMAISQSNVIPKTPKGNRIVVFGYNTRLANQEETNGGHEAGGLDATTQLVIPFEDFDYSKAHNTSRYDLFFHKVFGAALAEPESLVVMYIKDK